MFRRIVLLSLTLLAFSCAPSLAAESKDNFAQLRTWVGKYPNAKIDGKNVWDIKDFKQKLQDVMGPKRFKKFWDDFDISFPMEQEGDLLFLSYCKPHECVGVQADIFVNLKDDDVQVCWTNEEDYESVWLRQGKKPVQLKPVECGLWVKSDLFKKMNEKP